MAIDPHILKVVLATGDVTDLNNDDLAEYIIAVCESLGVNPLTGPFSVMEVDRGAGKRQILYATRDLTDQLRQAKGISITIVSRENLDGVFAVTARAQTPEGRQDEAIGAVPLVKELWEYDQAAKKRVPTGRMEPLSPDSRANALMKAETKAKRRVTLSICGLGMSDDSEVDSIPGAERVARGSKAEAQAVAERKIAENNADLAKMADDAKAKWDAAAEKAKAGEKPKPESAAETFVKEVAKAAEPVKPSHTVRVDDEPEWLRQLAPDLGKKTGWQKIINEVFVPQMEQALGPDGAKARLGDILARHGVASYTEFGTRAAFKNFLRDVASCVEGLLALGAEAEDEVPEEVMA